MRNVLLEVCVGSVEDCIKADKGGAKRVELCYALYLGGITPSLASLSEVKKHCPKLSVSAMIRPRGAGFCYSDIEYETMQKEAYNMVKNEADAIVFGFLKEDRTLDTERMKKLCDIAHENGKKAVIHRAFDCVADQYKTAEKLIEIGIDRILTSGGATNAYEGIEVISKLQKDYGNDIEIMPGSGVKVNNVREIIEKTGVNQVHSSCGTWFSDPTTENGKVSYAYDGVHPLGYEGTDLETVKKMIAQFPIA